jgi:hypothetical protein
MVYFRKAVFMGHLMVPISFFLDSEGSTASSSIVLQDFSSAGPSEISHTREKRSSRSSPLNSTSSLQKVEFFL